MAAQASTDVIPGAPAGRVWWRRLLLIGLLAILGVLAALHALGGQMLIIIAACAGGALLLGGAIWRRFSSRGRARARERRWSVEFRRSGGGSIRRGGLNYPSQRGKGLLKPSSRGPALPRLRRGGGAMLGSSGSRPRRSSAAPPLRRKGGAGSGKIPGLPRGSGKFRGLSRGSGRTGSPAGRPKTGSPGRRRSGSGFRLPSLGRTSPGRSGAGTPGRRRAGAVMGRRRPGTNTGIPGGRRRRVTTGPGGAGIPGRGIGNRRSRALGRRKAGTGTGRGTAGRRPPGPGQRRAASGVTLVRPGRRHPVRRLRWDRQQRRNGQSPGRAISTGGRQPQGKQNSAPGPRPGWNHPVRRVRWDRAKRQRAKQLWWRNRARQRPGLMRRGWYAVAGTPQQRYNQAISRRAHRARVRAIGRRAAFNPYASRARWYAPWGIWTRGGGLRDSFRRWRFRRLARIPRDRNGVRLPVLARLARRWNIRRGRYPGLGIGRVPLRDRWRMAWYRNTSRDIWGRRWGRLRAAFTRRPPRPLAARWQPGWLRGMMTRLDRRRQDRWLGRNRPAVPGTRRPLVLAPDVAGHMTGPSLNGHGTTRGGRNVADVHAAADEIKGMIQTWIDANDLDQTLEDLHFIPRAVQEAFQNYAESLRENTNLAESIPEAVAQASATLAGVADQLQETIGFGVQRG